MVEGHYLNTRGLGATERSAFFFWPTTSIRKFKGDSCTEKKREPRAPFSRVELLFFSTWLWKINWLLALLLKTGLPRIAVILGWKNIGNGADLEKRAIFEMDPLSSNIQSKGHHFDTLGEPAWTFFEREAVCPSAKMALFWYHTGSHSTPFFFLLRCSHTSQFFVSFAWSCKFDQFLICVSFAWSSLIKQNRSSKTEDWSVKTEICTGHELPSLHLSITWEWCHTLT